ncbi:MAG: alpha/beta hydrolase [Granulosicoccus sp.]
MVFSTASCTRLFFYPQKELVRTPASLGFDYDDVYMTTRDGVRIHGWIIKPLKKPLGSVFFLHGNAENISTHIGSIEWLVEAGYQALIIDYRGYGLSDGVANVPDVFEDIRAGADWLLSSDPARPVVVFGQSLGASLTITALQRFPEITQQFDALISEAAFSRYRSIGREVAASHWLTWPFQYPVAWLLRRPYDPLDSIAELQIPLLLVHSVNDEIIGIHHARELYAQANNPKQLLETTGPHIQAVANPSNRIRILDFIEQLTIDD